MLEGNNELRVGDATTVVAFVHVARLRPHADSALSNAHSLQLNTKQHLRGNVQYSAQYII